MVPEQEQSITAMFEEQLAALMRRLRPRSLLLVSSSPGTLPFAVFESLPLVIHVEAGPALGNTSLVCRKDLLPFADDELDMVLSHHLLHDGLEAELDEFHRVIRPGGQLLIIGTGRFAGKRRADDQTPWLDVRPVIQNLRSKTFEVRQCQGFGLRGKVASLAASWQRPALRFSDVIMIRGRFKDNQPAVTPLRFNQPGAGGIRVPALDGLNREAV